MQCELLSHCECESLRVQTSYEDATILQLLRARNGNEKVSYCKQIART